MMPFKCNLDDNHVCDITAYFTDEFWSSEQYLPLCFSNTVSNVATVATSSASSPNSDPCFSDDAISISTSSSTPQSRRSPSLQSPGYELATSMSSSSLSLPSGSECFTPPPRASFSQVNAFNAISNMCTIHYMELYMVCLDCLILVCRGCCLSTHQFHRYWTLYSRSEPMWQEHAAVLLWAVRKMRNDIVDMTGRAPELEEIREHIEHWKRKLQLAVNRESELRASQAVPLTHLAYEANPSLTLFIPVQRFYTVSVQRHRRRIHLPVITFGSNGSQDGQFIRPWGVCCVDNRIIITDRGNHRVQVFDNNGQFMFKFGRPGSFAGEFNRPAGVCVNVVGQIVVADKDNHRIQIFSKTGLYLHKFGTNGSKAGQFNYPWDVATNRYNQILVSDTKNNRIQMFNSHGEFLKEYGFGKTSPMRKEFDLPRGVCFTNKDNIILTDFNNHKLAVMDTDMLRVKYIGSEGCGPEDFSRPQGVAIASNGMIAVADGKNDRIQILNKNGAFLCRFGDTGRTPGTFDRPQGLSFTAEGRLVVVDFESRVQIFDL